MSRALANMSVEDRRVAINRRQQEVTHRRKSKIGGVGLGMLAAMDALSPVRLMGFNKGVKQKPNPKLHRRQQGWRDLEKFRGSTMHGPGRRYPSGYRMPGSHK